MENYDLIIKEIENSKAEFEANDKKTEYLKQKLIKEINSGYGDFIKENSTKIEIIEETFKEKLIKRIKNFFKIF